MQSDVPVYLMHSWIEYVTTASGFKFKLEKIRIPDLEEGYIFRKGDDGIARETLKYECTAEVRMDGKYTDQLEVMYKLRRKEIMEM